MEKNLNTNHKTDEAPKLLDIGGTRVDQKDFEDFIVKNFGYVIRTYGMRLGKWFLKNFDIILAAIFLLPAMAGMKINGNDTPALLAAFTGIFFGFIAIYRRDPEFKKTVQELAAEGKARLSAFINEKIKTKLK